MTLSLSWACQRNTAQKIRTSNGLEFLNEEIRRKDRVIRIYPNEASVIRLIGALFLSRMNVGLLAGSISICKLTTMHQKTKTNQPRQQPDWILTGEKLHTYLDLTE